MSEPRKIDDEFLAGIVRQYNDHVAAGRMPAPAIAATENTGVRNVHRWVYVARQRGMLPPGTPPGLCGGKTPLRTIGPTGDAVRRNIKLLRIARRMSTVKLSEALRQIGQPIPATGITRIEKGERRVDVDDLTAIAFVFKVAAADLLMLPPECVVCHGAPPPGFACTECGTTTTKEQPSV